MHPPTIPIQASTSPGAWCYERFEGSPERVGHGGFLRANRASVAEDGRAQRRDGRPTTTGDVHRPVYTITVIDLESSESRHVGWAPRIPNPRGPGPKVDNWVLGRSRSSVAEKENCHMKITTTPEPLETIEADALVVGVYREQLTKAAESIDRATAAC